MIKKWLLFLCWAYALTASLSIFCMLEEIKAPTELINPTRTFEWSAYFNEANEQLEKSYVFNTNEQDKKIILLQTNKNLHFFQHRSNEDLVKIAVDSSKDFPAIDHYIPFAYQTTTHLSENDEYAFYITSKKTTFFDKEKYSVSRITINNLTGRIKNKPLFEHDTPIMHLDMINKSGQDFLVAGSLYPSIKIYDLQEEKVVHTLYNRFLLGCVNNTLFYARKEDTERRKNHFTRWFYKDLDKKYNCFLCMLSNSFNTKNEHSKDGQDKQTFIEISKKDYPLIAQNNDFLVVLDQKEKNMLIWSSTKNNILSMHAEPSQTIPDLKDFKKYLKQIFSDSNFLHLIKSRITYENYKTFLLNKKHRHDNKQNEQFFQWLIEDILSKKIQSEKAIKVVTKTIVNEYSKELTLNNISAINSSYIYQKLQEHFTQDILNRIPNKLLSELATEKNIQVYAPSSFLGKAKNIYADKQSVFLQIDQAVWQLDLTKPNTFALLYKNESKNDSVENLFTLNNKLWLVTKEGLLEIDLSKKVTKDH